MKIALILPTVLGLRLAARAPSEEPGAAQVTPQPTREFKTSLPEATRARRVPTNTPVPPFTRTLRSTSAAALIPTQAILQETTAPIAPTTALAAVTQDVFQIPTGPFTLGRDDADPEDAPAHRVDLPVNAIDRFEVTNADEAASY